MRYALKTRGEMQLTDVDRLNPDTLLDMGSLRAVAHLVRQHLRLAESVHEGSTSSARSTCKSGCSEHTCREGGEDVQTRPQRGASVRVGR